MSSFSYMNMFFEKTGRVVAALGDYLILMYRCVALPDKPSMYWKETFRQAMGIGVGSLTIISVVSIFVGAVSGLQFAYAFKSSSLIPMWWIGSTVRKSMILELAPTISALLLAGKLGSSLSSELGSMRLTEQIDAFELMGVNAPAYLIGPKIGASVIVVPMLVVIAVFLGIAGGCAAGVLKGVFTYSEYMKGLTDKFEGYDVFIMLVKSVLFGFVLSSVPCYKGYTVQGGSVELGRASTEAVVYSSVAIIVINFLVAFVLM